MMKSIEEWSNDTKKIGILAKRAGYATNYLTTEETNLAFKKWEEELQNFANEYSISIDTAKSISIIMSDNIKLSF